MSQSHRLASGSSPELVATSVFPDSRQVNRAVAERAFAVKLHEFRKHGHTFRAPTGAATVPAAVAGQVLGVTGLSNEQHVMKPAATYPPAFVNARPCSQYYGQVAATYQADFKTKLPKFQGKTLPYAPCGYRPDQFRAGYEGNTALSGAGQAVAAEPVPGTADGFQRHDAERPVDLVAQRADVLVDHVGAGLDGEVPAALQQCVAGQDHVRVAQERGQQRELLGRQVDRDITPIHLPGGGVQP